MIHDTSDFWREWLNKGEFPDHPWRSHLQRTALTLKGLTYAPTGALIAAPTTSLPEIAGRRTELGLPLQLGARLDVRAVGALHARVRLRGQQLLLLHRRPDPQDGAPLQVMYGVGGETELEESTLDHLTGYDNARPVRIGNGAYEPGAARRLGCHARLGLPAPAIAASSSPGVAWPVLKRQVEEAIEHWREPDHGHLGDARRAAALHVVEDHVLGRVRPRRAASPT